MSGPVSIIRERFPRLVAEIEAVTPPGLLDALDGIALDATDEAALRGVLALVSDDRVERVTSAASRFLRAVLSAVSALASDLGPDDVLAVVEYAQAKYLERLAGGPN